MPNSFDIKNLLRDISKDAENDARDFALDVAAACLSQGQTPEEAAETVRQEVADAVIARAAFINVGGGSFTSVQEEAAVAVGWATFSRDIRFGGVDVIVELAAERVVA